MKRQILAYCLLAVITLTGCGAFQKEAQSEQFENTSSEAATAVTSETQPAASISSGFVDSGTEEYAAVYQMPDATSTAVARGYTGDAVEIFALQGQWYQVKLGEISGYIKADQVTFSKPSEQPAAAAEAAAPAAETPAPAAAEAPTPAETQAVNVTITLQYDNDGIALPKSYTAYESYDSGRNAYCSVTSCYIYKTASTSGPKRQADMLYNGDAVTVYGTYNDFYYIGTDSGSGYELMGYVQTKNITIGTPPAAQDKSYSATQGYVDVQSCNVRSSPSKETNDNVIDTIYKGTTFTINSFDGYWYYINYNGKSGYVSYKMVTVY